MTSTGRPRRRFGQHFLEPPWVEKILDAIDPRPGEMFVEIGPGRGALTRPLAARADRVVAFEIDRDLVRELQAAALPGVTIVEADFLRVSANELRDRLIAAAGRLSGRDRGGAPDREPRVRVAGNLPYNVASPILFRLIDLFDAGVPLVDATVLVQHEVAERLAAAPGTRAYGVLGILVRHSARIERLLTLPAGAFRPAPKVRSALVRLTFHAPWPPVGDRALFRDLVQALFTRRRKTLVNALAAFRPPVPLPPPDALHVAALDGRRRPETLGLAELVRLADVYARRAAADPRA